MRRRLQYQDIMFSILELIGKLNLGIKDKLPSQRKLCSQFGQSMITIRRAIQELERDGILRVEPGKGVFVERDIKRSRKKAAILLLDINRGQNHPAINSEELNQTKNNVNKNGYEFQMLACDKDPSDYVVKEAARAVGVFATGILNDNWKTFLSSLNIPVVVVGNKNDKTIKLKTVYRDVKSDVVKALDYFVSKGMTRIGFLNAAKSYCYTPNLMAAYKSHLKKLGILYNEEIVVMLEKESRYDDMYCFLKKNSAEIDCLLVESGIYSYLMEAAYINHDLPKLPIAIVGGMSKMIHCDSPKLTQFGPSISTFQVALDVLYDQLQCSEKQVYKKNAIKVASKKIEN